MLLVIVTAIAVGVGVLVYVERYSYVGHDPDLYRVDRWHGDVTKWTPTGWTIVPPTVTPPQPTTVDDPFADLARPRR